MTRCIGYLRVSTLDQDIEKNKGEMGLLANQNNLAKIEFVEDFVSGKVSWKKRKIYDILQELKKGDAIVVSEFSRLGRSMVECMEVLALAMEKEIRIYAVKGNWVLDDSIQSKVMAMVFAMASEIERDLISKRTKEALQAKKRMGIKLGRPIGPGKSKLDPYKEEIIALLSQGSTQKYISKKYNITEATIHNWMKKNKIKRAVL